MNLNLFPFFLLYSWVQPHSLNIAESGIAMKNPNQELFSEAGQSSFQNVKPPNEDHL